MTMADERARALVGAHELVQLVLSDPTASAELKSHARWVARHYPSPHEIDFEARRQTHPDPAFQSLLSEPWLAPFNPST